MKPIEIFPRLTTSYIRWISTFFVIQRYANRIEEAARTTIDEDIAANPVNAAKTTRSKFPSTAIGYLLLTILLYGCNKKKVYSRAETLYADTNQIDSTAIGYVLLKTGSYGFQKGNYVLTARIPYHIVGKHKVFQGDILVDPIMDKDSLIMKYQQKDSKFWGRPSGPWPDGIIYYKIAPAVKKYARDQIALAIQTWTTASAGVITFKQASASNQNYLVFKSGTGYASEVGMRGGPQEIISTGIPDKGNIMHEMGHAIGLWHEHSRQDRDQYIKIDLTNVIPSERAQFATSIATDGSTEGIGYDYASVMHYGSQAMAIDETKPTITPIKDRNAQIGNRQSPSEWDIAGVKKLYNH